MSVFAILIPEFSAILSPPKMNHYNRFPISNHMQTGHISICRFTDGLELKYAELQTLSQIESEVRFDPDLRLIFTLEGTTHLQLGKREVFLHASDSQTAVLLPVNQPTDGRKIFYSGRQNELVLFCSSQLLAQMGCPPEVLRLFRSSHLEPHYFHPTASIQMHLNNLLSVSAKPEIWQNFHRHGQMLLLMGEVLQTLFPVIPSDETLARKRLQKLITLLHDPRHFNENIETFARLCNTNPTTLQRDFQTTFHTSIARYHREYRLNRARSALKQAQTVYQAAQLAGYDNPECFSKAFKKQFGSNPSEYRMKAV